METISEVSNDTSSNILKIAHNDDDQSWPETLRKCEGEGLSSQARLQRDLISDELNLCQQWCSEVRVLVSDMVSETHIADAQEIACIESALIDIERGHEQAGLIVETMASIYIETERHTIMSLHQEKRILLEYGTMSQISRERYALHTHIYQYFYKQRRDARRLCGRMPSLLQHTGQLLQISCDRIFNQQRCSLLDRMTELGLDLSELGSGALYTPIRCKVALNADDCHPDLVLSNSCYSATQTQPVSNHPKWATVRATNPVSPYPRHPNHRARRFIHSTLGALRDPSKDLPADQLIDMLWACLRTIHADSMASDRVRALLADRQKQHQATGSAFPTRRRSRQRRLSVDQDTPMANLILSSSDPKSGRDMAFDPMKGGSASILQMTLELMGYHPGPDQIPLDQITLPLQLRSRALDLIQTMEQRCQVHGRFFFEALCSESACDWMVGVTNGAVIRPDYLGQDAYSMGVAADGRAYFNRQSMIFSSGFRPGQIVGVLIDMFHGSIHIFRDGVELGVAFGYGSRTFPSAAVEAQTQLLTGDQLFPAISIRGLPLSTTSNGKGRADDASKRAPPQISVNLGQLPFSFPVPATTPVEKCRMFASEADSMKLIDDEFLLSPVLNGSVRKIIIEGDESVGEGRLPTQTEFISNIECEPPTSFSIFPPRETRILQAVIIIQRSVRAFLIRIRQAFFQRDVIRARKLRQNATLFIQRRFRGNRARIVTSILIRKHLKFTKFIKYVIYIQRWWRRVVETPMFQKRREEWLKNPRSRRNQCWAFIFGKLGGNRPERLKMLHQEALKLQKVWRGRQVRVAFFNQNPIDAIRLNNLGFALRSRLESLRLILIAKPYMLGWVQRARYRLWKTRLQKAMRIMNRSLREYMVRSRLDEMMDATLSEPLKKFVYLLGKDSRLFDSEPTAKS